MKQRAYGFTIVELLIVIVVVAILAALSYVGYVNISNRTHDAAVQSDLRNFTGKMQEYYAIEGSYPGSASNSTGPAGMNFAIARASYSVLSHNLYYCRSTESGVDGFAVIARSASGNIFIYRSNQGMRPYGSVWPTNVNNFCASNGWASYDYTFGYHATHGWRTWTE